MKTPRQFTAFTLIELLVVISIIAILASLAIPAVTNALVRGQLTQTLNNARQLTMATQQMSLDSFTAGSGPSWSTSDGSTVYGTANDFYAALVANNYLTVSDVKKLINGPGLQQFTGATITGISTNNSAFALFPTTETSPSDAAFLVTQNWSTTGMLTNANPYGAKGFVLFRKGGDGSTYTRNSDATNTNNFGTNFSATLIK